MTESDLTIKILQGIRDDLQRSNQDNAQRFEALTTTMNERFEAVNARFEVVETVLRDMSEQMVMQLRGIKAAIEAVGSAQGPVLPHVELLRG